MTLVWLPVHLNWWWHGCRITVACAPTIPAAEGMYLPWTQFLPWTQLAMYQSWLLGLTPAVEPDSAPGHGTVGAGFGSPVVGSYDESHYSARVKTAHATSSLLGGSSRSAVGSRRG